MKTTAQTEIRDTCITKTQKSLYDFFDDYAALLCGIERKLYKSYRQGNPIAGQKNLFLSQYGITARQFNSVSFTLNGKISSAIGCQKLNRNNLKDRIKILKKP